MVRLCRQSMVTTSIACACKTMAEVCCTNVSHAASGIHGWCTSDVQCQEFPQESPISNSVRLHTWTKLCAKAMTRTLLRRVLESPSTVARASTIGWREGGITFGDPTVGPVCQNIPRILSAKRNGCGPKSWWRLASSVSDKSRRHVCPKINSSFARVPLCNQNIQA